MTRNPSTFASLLRGGLLALLVAMLSFANASAQIFQRRVIINGNVVDEEEERGETNAENDIFLPADRTILKKLSEAKKLIAAERYGEASQSIDAILELPEDYFFRPEDEKKPKRKEPANTPAWHYGRARQGGGVSFNTLKSEAQRLIGQMPREGREQYELQFGDRARHMLEQAIVSGDATTLSHVSWRYFHTKAGYQATYLLGLYHFEHGQALAGAATLQRLCEFESAAKEFEPSLSLMAAACWLRADSAENAKKLLVALRKRQPNLRVNVGGRESPIFTDDARAVDWLKDLLGKRTAGAVLAADQWLLFRGNPARTAATVGGEPLLSMQWHVSTADDTSTGAILRIYQKMQAECGAPMIPAMHPLAVGDTLLLRTPQALMAIDLSTGKLNWASPDFPHSAGSATNAAEPLALNAANNAQERMKLAVQQIQKAHNLSQRMWSDLVGNTLSSDGQRVFAVENISDDAGNTQANDGVIFGRGGRLFIRGRVFINGRMNNDKTPMLCNRLAAYDLSGRLRWRIGGPSDARSSRLTDMFFLGPPLPLMGQLFALAEKNGEIRLLVLDAATGETLWTQQLSLAEPNILQDPMRQFVGASPSCADGILVCPTSAGAVVALDLATHSLLWGYSYDRDQNQNPYQMAMIINQFNRIMDDESAQPSHWLDGSITICEGRVLLTPVESNWIFCLRLSDGKLLWKTSRNADWYVAGANRDHVVLVGRRGMRAIKLTDGGDAWTNHFPDGCSVSGRGFLAENKKYFVPLSNATIAAVDMASGKVVQTAKSRQGTVAGNLLCHAGKIISVGLEGIDAYFELSKATEEVRRRLKNDLQDADAMLLRGEILLSENRRNDALAEFRNALKIEPSPRSRQLLRDTLIEGLRNDFAAYRGQADELEKLLDDPSQRVLFWQTMTTGLRRDDRPAEALKYCLKLLEMDPNLRAFDRVDKSLSVCRDRWFRSQLIAIRSEAKGEEAEKIDQLVTAKLKQAMSDDSIESLQRYWSCFGGVSAAAPARTELIRRLTDAGRTIEAELAAPPASVADNAPADNSTSTPNVKTKEGEKLGKSDGIPAWPVGKVNVSVKAVGDANGGVSFHDGNYRGWLELRGKQPPYLRDLSFRFTRNNSSNGSIMLACNDGFGVERWTTLLRHSGLQQMPQEMFYNHTPYSTSICGYADGHLMVALLGGKIVAIDLLGKESKGAARVLWTRDSLDTILDGILPQHTNQDDPACSLLRQQFASVGNQSNPLGLLRHEYLCFQRFRNLTALNPRSGETLWIRQNIPPGCILFGDEELIFALPPNRDKAMVFRASDGEQLGTCKVPRIGSGRRVYPDGETRAVYNEFSNSCLGTVGRKMLLWWPEGNQRTLTMTDPWEGRDVWRGRKFAADSKTFILNSEAVGVMEPSGHFTLVALADGRVLADLQLEKTNNLQEIFLFGSDEQRFLLVASSPTESSNFQAIQSASGYIFKQVYSGKLYAIDRQGKLSWPAPVSVKNQCLLMNGPTQLPIIIFACHRYEQMPNGSHGSMLRTLCIDKRNGRVICNKKKEFSDGGYGRFNIVGNPSKKTVELTAGNTLLSMTFTDKPLTSDSRDGQSPVKAIQQKLIDSTDGAG